jgi:hypothetical protein
MNMKSRWICSLSAALLLSFAASAQEAGPGPDSVPPPPRHGPMHGPGFGFGDRMELLGIGGPHGGKVVTGAPFTATAVSETTHKLADGTTISRKSQTILYRDAQGRFRKDVTMSGVGPVAASGTPKTVIVIQDPVAAIGYVLMPDQKVARKFPERPKATPDANTAEPSDKKWHGGPDNDPNVKKDSLGTQTINGVAATGTRYTRTIPAGQIGNDKPLTVIREEWYSTDLQILVQSKRTDPFEGETVYNVTNIQRNAPSAALFSVPADYTVKDAPGPGGPRRGHHPGGTPAVPPADAPSM